jgi:hypothetical protein
MHGIFTGTVTLEVKINKSKCSNKILLVVLEKQVMKIFLNALKQRQEYWNILKKIIYIVLTQIKEFKGDGLQPVYKNGTLFQSSGSAERSFPKLQ